MVNEVDPHDRFRCRPKNPQVLISTLVQLIEHPVSQQEPRHVEMLNDFISATQCAFCLRDISRIARLYEYLGKKIPAVPKFQPIVRQLLKLSAAAPMYQKSSEKTKYEKDFQQYFTALGHLAYTLAEDEVGYLTLKSIKSLMGKNSQVIHCCTAVEYAEAAAEGSDLPKILAKLLITVPDNTYPLLLDVMYIICEKSKLACQKMLDYNAIEYLFQRLQPSWSLTNYDIKSIPSPSDELPNLECTCSILWKLLNAVNREDDNVRPPTIFALWSVQYVLRWTIIFPENRMHRNNFMAIILKCLEVFPEMDFIACGLADDILSYAAAAAGFEDRFNLSFPDEQNLEFAKITWCTLFYYTLYDTRKIILGHRVIEALIEWLFKKPVIDKSYIEYHSALSKVVLKLIPIFLNYSLQSFLDLDAPSKMIDMIEEYLHESYEINTLEARLKCLNTIFDLTIKKIMVINEFNTCVGADKINDVIVGICNQILENAALTSAYQKCLAHCFCILDKLGAVDEAPNQQIVIVCMNYLEHVIHPKESDSVLDMRVTIHAVHLLWNNVFTSNLAYSEFLKRSGIYVMLDVAENCAFPVKTLALGLLSDTSVKSSCVPYLITWRKRGRRLLPTLMEIFRNNAEDPCDTFQNNIFSVTKDDKVWLRLCNSAKMRLDNSCLSKTGLLESSRINIYAILRSLRVGHIEKVEEANESYQLFNEQLNADDELTMVFAQNFTSIRKSEMWKRIKKTVIAEGIVPVLEDHRRLSTEVKRFKKWKVYVRYKVRQIVHNETENENNSESETYTILKEARLSDALDALKELHYRASCTERYFHVRNQIMFAQEVDLESLKISNLHRTIGGLVMPNLYNQTVEIQSNTIRSKHETHLSPVSSEENITITTNTSRDKLSEPILEC